MGALRVWLPTQDGVPSVSPPPGTRVPRPVSMGWLKLKTTSGVVSGTRPAPSAGVEEDTVGDAPALTVKLKLTEPCMGLPATSEKLAMVTRRFARSGSPPGTRT